MDRNQQQQQPKNDEVENLPEPKRARDQQQPTPEQEESVKGGLASTTEKKPDWFARG